MKRYLFHQIIKDLKKKMVFITGPRQVGKTYLAHQVMKNFKKPIYLNYDNIDDQRIIQQRSWRLNSDLIIFDEVHKMKNWKTFLKGIYDSKPKNQAILITGSARLETYRQSGESLAGRYLHLRLNPFSVKELKNLMSPYDAIEKLNTLGGFPEPFLSNSEEEAARWRNQYYTDLIREDIFEFSRINEIRAMKLLLELLRTKVGSPVSYKSLAEDLQVSPNTIKKYIYILEGLYIIFLIRPFHKKISRSLLKEPKLYFYDSGFIKGKEGKILENTCAVCLLKYVQFLHDAKGKNITLNYIKTKEGKEIDFAIVKNDIPLKFIEIKLSDNKPTNPLKTFSRNFPDTHSIQLVHNLRQPEQQGKIEINQAGDWLATLPA